MRSEKIILRKKPTLEFILNKKYFEIINNQNNTDNGIYFYEWTKSVNFQKEKTNWIFTIFSYIIEFFLAIFIFDGAADGGKKYRKKGNLLIYYKDKNIEIKLNDCNLKNAEYLTKELELKLT